MKKTLLFFAASSFAVNVPAQTTKSASPTVPPSIVTIMAHDFSFLAPDRIPAGRTIIRVMNHGPQIHHAQLVKFAGNHKVKDYVAALKSKGPPPAWATMVGGPNAIDPRETSEVTQILEPGNYGIVCFVDTPDHIPHVLKGMSKDIIVTNPPKNVGKLPAGDITVSLVDYNFKLSKPLVAGHQTLTVTTNANQPHELTVIKLARGKTTKDLLGWINTMKGPPAGKLVGGVAALAKGRSVSVPLDITPGNYVLICFVPDAKDGKPHFMHGMLQEHKVQ